MSTGSSCKADYEEMNKAVLQVRKPPKRLGDWLYMTKDPNPAHLATKTTLLETTLSWPF